MKKKSRDPLSEKIILPKQKGIKEAILRPKDFMTYGEGIAIVMRARESEEDRRKRFINNLKEEFKNLLLTTSFFKEQTDEKIDFHDPRVLRRKSSLVPCKNPEALLDGLTETLANFFWSEKEKYKGIKPAIEIFDAFESILFNNEVLLSSGVKAKSLLDVIDKLRKWSFKVHNYLLSKIHPTQTSKLVRILYNTFRKNLDKKELSDNGVFLIIATILKHLGLEGGRLDRISRSIERDFYRRRK